MTLYLNFDDALQLVRDLGVGPVVDPGSLDSALHRPRSVIYGEEAYGGIAAKAAVLLESIVRNHPLADGNKRLGWLSVVVFCGLNGIEVEAPDDVVYDLVIAVANGRLGWREIAGQLEPMLHPV
ncbi:type II toxin-antitoxin system death-on-curing family toxin [Corynebacterium xerosis]|uniref:Type II toxin-antitoxin system death-on-curing family toxin n=1 Tax=Corynebacterium xerosis TaxID=1725 RepID=A0A6B8TTB1_9CORY|nr:type II toxin-antitoxin system death-on-curing family toxin [Corynebacterium xerosis]QGS34403.1 type II toxin-antitoxin system death-on-curing family toxin [Corynebacterium xerosis]